MSVSESARVRARVWCECGCACECAYACEYGRTNTHNFVFVRWSLGTLIWKMIVGFFPFYDPNKDNMYRKILDCQLVQPEIMSTPAYHVCLGLLNRDPTNRLGYKGADEVSRLKFV